jgi:Uma2 family endonuclease
MSTVPRPRFTPGEYLERERQALTKSEYYQGEIFAMAGASRQHSLIQTNLIMELGNRLRDRPCEVHGSDMRVKITPTGLYTYPDASVVCGKPRFEDRLGDTLLNPVVVLEVLSESTESYDRGTKARHYRRIESLQELVLISQSAAEVERHCRQPDGNWLLTEILGLDATLTLASISVAIPLAEVYRGIEFPSPHQADNDAISG